MAGIAAALNTAVPPGAGRDGPPPRAAATQPRRPGPAPGSVSPALRATVVAIGVVLTGLVATIVYLYVRNSRRLADTMALQHSLEVNARMFAAQFQQVLSATPHAAGGRSKGDAAPPTIATPAVAAFLRTVDATAVSDAEDGVVTLEVVDSDSGSVWASSLHPDWAVGPAGRRPGRTLEDVATEDGVRVGELLRAARAKGGSYIEFKYLDSGRNLVMTRTAFAAPVSNTALLILAGVSR